jgi:hypothetical protein
MGDLPRWASRFQFSRELWSDADRLVLDPALERALASGQLAAGEGPIFAELADALLPHNAEGPRAWFLAERGRRVAEYARQRAGTVFSDLRDGAQVVAEERWKMAQVDLTGLLADDLAGGTTSLDDRISPTVSALLETLSERAEEGRAVVLSVPSRQVMGKRGVGEEVFFEYLAQNFPSARVYGLADSPSVGIFDFGPIEAEEEDEYEEYEEDGGERTEVHRGRSELESGGDEAAYDAELDEAERTWSGEETEPGVPARSEDEESEGVPIDYDNSLGAFEPRYFAYLALVGVQQPPLGLTLVELAAEELGTDDAQRGADLSGLVDRESGADASGLRAQLSEAQRQADLLAVERQALLERLDDADERIEALEELLEDPDAPRGERVTSIVGEFEAQGPVPSGELVGRLDAALAREQELRWRVQSLTSQLEAAAARPVDALESEAARLRARLERLEAGAGPADDAIGVGSSTETETATPAASSVSVATAPSAPGRREREELRGAVEQLMRKVERGGLNGMELHRALRRIRQRLNRH